MTITKVDFSRAQRATINDNTAPKITPGVNLRGWKVKRRVFLGLTVFSFVAALMQCAFATEPVMKTLSAHVVKVAEDGQSLQTDFRHPATGKLYHLTFYVDHQTGLSGIETLQELRSGQVVNIDYVEEKGRRYIRHLARVKLSGPPAGLEHFRGF